MPSDSLGFVLELNELVELTADPERFARFRKELDQLAVARIVLGKLASEAAVTALAGALGEPEPAHTYGADAPGVGEARIIGDFSAPARVDDGRPRQRAFIESLHVDVLPGGWASHGILATRHVPAAEPMRWVDMRAVYRSLPADTQRFLQGLRGVQLGRATRAKPRPDAFEQPLIALHPHTHEPMLLLPDRVRGSIVGCPPDESRALIAGLWRTVDAAPGLDLALRDGELYVWDNLTTVHTNPAFPRANDRSIWFLNTRCTDQLRRAAH
jgi:alpha-ketoglutarate-dependent taurine dioxygenase